jgi:hypothetical protein
MIIEQERASVFLERLQLTMELPRDSDLHSNLTSFASWEPFLLSQIQSTMLVNRRKYIYGSSVKYSRCPN